MNLAQLPNTLPFGTSLARQVARQNLTRFNNIFWMAERARKHIRAGFAHVDQPDAGPGVHGIFNTEDEWQDAADELREWIRQHVLISAAGLLEVYLTSITTTALQAKPELLDRSLEGVDGYAFILGKAVPPDGWAKSIEAAVSSFTSGLWTHRLRRLETVFGRLPTKLTALTPDLQKIQNKRNKIAHQFGADRDRRVPWDAISRVVVGAKDCETAIRVVSAFIAEADKGVFGPLVGAHEVLAIYHDWARKDQNFGRHRVLNTRATGLCDHVGQLNGQGLGRDYAKAIIDHYDSL